MKKISEEQIAAIYRKAWVPVRDLPPTYLGKDGKLYDATGKVIPWSGFAGIPLMTQNPCRESWLYRQWKKFRGES